MKRGVFVILFILLALTFFYSPSSVAHPEEIPEDIAILFPDNEDLNRPEKLGIENFEELFKIL